MSKLPTVYVVDDDEGVRRALTFLLEGEGLNVACFSSSQEFLDAYKASMPGCAVLDIRMSGMNGLDLQDELRRRGIPLPVIFLSGHGDVPDSVRAMKSGAVDFLEKPQSEPELLEAIKRAMAIDAQLRLRFDTKTDINRRLDLLTVRERELLDHLITGKHTKRIASDLGISEKTVAAHRTAVLQKMKTDSVVELVYMLLSNEIESVA